MTTPVDTLLDAFEEAGGSLRWDAGKRGYAVQGTVPPEILEQLRTRKAEVHEAWPRRQQARRQRWAWPPPVSLPQAERPVSLRADVRRRLVAFVLSQSPEVQVWAGLRSAAYLARGWPKGEAEGTAAVDVIKWQLGHHPDPVRVVVDLGEQKPTTVLQ